MIKDTMILISLAIVVGFVAYSLRQKAPKWSKGLMIGAIVIALIPALTILYLIYATMTGLSI